jgi:hypothetical protein
MFPTLSFGDEEFSPEEMRASSAKVAGAMVVAGLKEGPSGQTRSGCPEIMLKKR